MPVIHIRAVTQDKQENRNTYECPIYKTRQRGGTEVQYTTVKNCVLSRSDLHLDFQPQDQGKTLEMGSGRGGSPPSDLIVLNSYMTNSKYLIHTICTHLKQYTPYARS